MSLSTFSRLRRCCDPFNCHPKSARKIRTTYSDLRLVPRNLIARFPSLNLNPANKVCSVCRRKLYALHGSHTLDSQDGHVTPDAAHQIPENQPAVSANMSSDDQSAQLDTDVRCEVSMEVNPETNVEQMEVDLNPAQLTLAQGGDEVNPEPDDSEDADDGAPSSSSSSQDASSECRVLNEALLLIGVSPISKREIQKHGNSYCQMKLEGILNCLSQKLGANPSLDSESEIISQLKEKFKSATKRSEFLQILTVLPKSWSVQRIMKEFGTSKRMAKRAKDLVDEKGILSTPNTKVGKSLPNATVQLVQDFYSGDEVSRAMPGKKDYVSVGRKVHRQKQLILCNLKDSRPNTLV